MTPKECTQYQCTYPSDLDATDGACPAWWRGEAHAAKTWAQKERKVLIDLWKVAGALYPRVGDTQEAKVLLSALAAANDLLVAQAEARAHWLSPEYEGPADVRQALLEAYATLKDISILYAGEKSGISTQIRNKGLLAHIAKTLTRLRKVLDLEKGTP